MPHLVKMFGGDVNTAVEPADRPSVEVDAVEHGSVAQWGKELILLNERQAVEDALAAIIEGQVQPIAIKGADGCNPFQGVALWAMILMLGRTSKFVLLLLNRIICLFHTR